MGVNATVRGGYLDTLAAMLGRASYSDVILRLARVQSAEVLATVVAERIVEELGRAGFVVMKRPPEIGGGRWGGALRVS
jgi:hypothetical protein